MVFHIPIGGAAMLPIAEIVLSPGGIMSWIAIGLLAGWLAGVTMSGGGYGIVRDVVLGLVGALVGGFIASFFIQGDAGFWGSLLVALLGSCLVIGVARLFSSKPVQRL
jgi:uncharacterized membrane protein YeaQ/YmgE (transglycosylase-associated protein family)